jgi:hypothetical protein
VSFFGLLGIGPFVLIQLGIVASYLLYWDFYPKGTAQRFFAWLLSAIAVVGIPFLQIKLYQQITSEKGIPIVVAITVTAECLLSIGLAFRLLRRRRRTPVSK